MSLEPNRVLPGPIVLFGSGETSPSGRKVFDLLMRKMYPGPRVALLETPAGFELNSRQVIGRVGEFLQERLQNYQPEIDIVRARARGTALSPDNPEILAPLLEADMIFMGPGSPTYAVRQLRDSLAWQMLLARHRLGAALVLASAAAIAVSAFALPVYEIYKVGEDLHWKPGLDFFGLYGLPLVIIPHWNNNDGGEELDTSRCFMGKARFARLMELLPPDLTVIGIDEKTALIMNVQAGVAQAVGLGNVTLIHTGHAHRRHHPQPELKGSGLTEVAEQRSGHVHVYAPGQTFPLSECCPLEMPGFGMGLSPEIWQQAIEAWQRLEVRRQTDNGEPVEETIPVEIQALVKERQSARLRKDWAAADVLRGQIEALGWTVKDRPQEPLVERLK